MTAILAAVVGGLLVAASNYIFLRVQERTRRRDELRTALVELGASLDRVGLLVRTLPRSTAPARAASRLLARAPNLESGMTRLSTRVFFPELRATVDTCHVAMNRVLLVAPAVLLEPLLDVVELLGEAETGPARDWEERWDAARVELITSSREALGEDSIGIRSQTRGAAE